MVFKTDDQIDEDRYCDSTPIGEKWPVCNLFKGHKVKHESADYTWEDGGPAIIKTGPTNAA